ncbi:hypothetical protein PUN28_018210 [Cardiocondyla obscurior]|uniref:Fibroin heavy chain-like n=1 Tax=Cardiocondyla obscurior TaxID=286306 RepID=A0AAW2EM73_9HYME
MWTRSFNCFLVTVLFPCVFLVGSGKVSANAPQNVENTAGAHDGHKGIRSYDDTGFPHDGNVNRDIKSYGAPSGHGAVHGTKGGGHGYNKHDDGCSKCKWENDEYWERDEPEEEGDENDGDECDDGQYRPDKIHYHGPGGGRHKPYPASVHKTGPTGVYVDSGIKGIGVPGGPSSGINYPAQGAGYTRPISGYETTSAPRPSWSTPFADAPKPGYGGVTSGAFGTTPSPWPEWNRRTTPSSFSSTPKPWTGDHDARFPASQQPGASVPNFGVTSKPEQGWNNNPFLSGFPSTVPHAPHAGSGIYSPSPYGNSQQNQNKPYGQPGTQSTYAGAYAGASVTPGIGNPGEPFNFGRKDHPFGFYKPVNTQTPHGPHSGTSQTPFNNNNPYGFGNYQPEPGSYSTQPTIVTNTFGTTKRPYGEIGPSKTVPGIQQNPFAPGKSPGSPSGSNVYEHPSVTKPSYTGSTPSWLNTGQTGSSTWHDARTTPYAGFGTTKTPFNNVNVPSSELSPPYEKIGPKQPGFNFASSSSTASASANAFATSPGTYSTTSTETYPFYGTTPAHRRDPNYTPGIQGSIGSTNPAYGSVPQGTYPNIGSSPNKQPGDGRGTWPNQGQPGYGNRPVCAGGNCGGTTSPQGSSNCGGCCGNYNCNSGCSKGTPGLCDGRAGPSQVNKTYYPAGTGDGNVPSIGSQYRPDSRPNIGAIYPGTQGTSITSETPISWNSVNPFLYPVGGNTPTSYWTETTEKPIGVGNPFLDPNFSSPKPGYSNTYNDKNVIPHAEGNTKPVGQGNLFLDGSNKKDDDKPIQGVIPLGEKIPGENNPFLTPLLNGGSSLGNPSYGKHPDKSGPSGSYPGAGPSGSYPGTGPSGSYPGAGPSGSYPGTGPSGSYPGAGPSGNYPGAGPSGSYPGAGPSGSYPGAGPSGNYPGAGPSGNYPGAGPSGNYPGAGTPGNYPGYGGVKGSNFDRTSLQDNRHSTGSNAQAASPGCKLGMFGCGTPGSGSYGTNKYPAGAFGGNIGVNPVNPGSAGNFPNTSGYPGINPGANHPGSEGNNLGTSIGGGQARAYAGSFSSAQASSSAQAASSSFAGSFSSALGPANNFGRNLSPNEPQNQGGPNSWASSGASAFASSSAGSWSGNRPVDVKG